MLDIYDSHGSAGNVARQPIAKSRGLAILNGNLARASRHECQDCQPEEGRMSRVPVESREFAAANVLGVTVGTSCPQGGDSGHGGRTLLRLRDLGGTDLRARVEQDDQGRACVELILGGDSECATFVQALEFALSVLRAQMRAKHEEVE
jgi:hypothetical protein